MTRRGWAGRAKGPLLAGGAVIATVLAGLVAGRRDPAPPVPAASGPVADIATRFARADPARGERLFATCAACHSVGRNGPDLDGPNLFGAVGAPLARRRPRYGYTAALRRAGGTWTPARLDAWLTAPARFAPGTSMGFAGLPDPADRADIMAFLARQGGSLPSPEP